MTYSATYSPDDNKLRLYASSRLPAETYARVKAAGFKWAPKQDLFFAPMWTPAREDLLIELAGEVGDEDKSLTARAEERAERFEGYSENRARDSETAHNAAGQISERFYGGQPILVGHHSEKRARRDQQRMHGHMTKAVTMWRRAQYWEERAKGALLHAKYKEAPSVRARRIKTIEADLRKCQRSLEKMQAKVALWTSCDSHDKARIFADASWAVVVEVEGHRYTASDVLRSDADRYAKCPAWTWGQVREKMISLYPPAIAHTERWIEHYNLRITYERAMLDEQGASDLLAPKPRRVQLPLLNYRAPGGAITTRNMYRNGENITYKQVDMTKLAYAAICSDYKGTRHSMDNSHRFRTAMINHALVAVFLTDSKEHPIPKADAPAEVAA